VLSKQLNVSRTPLREALISLERSQLVRSEPNVGYRVKEISVSEGRELYSLIQLLETHALALAFPLIQTQTSVLERINEDLYMNRSSAYKASLADRDFHHRLTMLCNNETLLKILAELRLRISCYEHCYMANEMLIEHSYRHHKALIESLRHSDIEGAKRALAENWSYAFGVIISEGSLRNF
jgi:DNA-binding GntR family transcriptional regulator